MLEKGLNPVKQPDLNKFYSVVVPVTVKTGNSTGAVQSSAEGAVLGHRVGPVPVFLSQRL